MKYFYVEPEVAGGLGRETEMDTSVHPPIVRRLHYELDGWLGDVLLESFPVFVVTEAAVEALTAACVSGANFDVATVTFSDTFIEQYRDRVLPRFFWLKPVGFTGRDDIGTALDGRLVVSERALRVIEPLGISNAVIQEFDGSHQA